MRVNSAENLTARRAQDAPTRGGALKSATVLEPSQVLLSTCDDRARDRALLLRAWSDGGRRRSEVVPTG